MFKAKAQLILRLGKSWVNLRMCATRSNRKMASEKDEVKLIPNSSLNVQKKKKKRLLWVLQCLMILMLIVLIFIYVRVAIFGSRKDCVGVVYVDYAHRQMYIPVSGNDEQSSYFGEMGKAMSKEIVQRRPLANGFEYSWKNGPRLVMQDLQDNCTSIQWSSLENLNGVYPLDCFVLANKNWYGGAELYKQVWPFEKAIMEMAAYYPQDTINAFYEKIPAFGPVLGRYWVNSQGVAIIVNQSSPLVVSINAATQPGHLCLSLDPTLYPVTKTPPELKYIVCKDNDVKAVHQAMVRKFFKKLTKGPDEKMMRDPVWSTWVKYHKGVNQLEVQKFLSLIEANKFSCSQLEIDDKYTTTYGDLDFEPLKFPDPIGMINSIHNAGCRVTTWIHPFAEIASKAYAEGKKAGYFVVGSDGKTPGIVKWWNGLAAVIDFTKPDAYNWFLNRLKAFQTKYNIDSFKFDGGSVSYLPFQYTLNGSKIPSDYSVQYAKLASDINNFVEVRVGDRSQDLSLFVRFLDRDASWDTEMGLQSVIPTVLTFGILGYPFILPDMIGGNGAPSKELFIRWMQLNTFLPAMQFSLAPWDFDNETIDIAHHMMYIRQRYIMPILLEGVKNAVKTGDPIIRPLWWVAPDDPVALTIDQQFMVTDVYLVAPIVTAGASTISVYLPKGMWMEQFGNKVKHTMTQGGRIVYNVSGLADVFYFKNLDMSLH